MKYKILKINAVMCPNCKYVLISRHVHDYVVCPCYIESNVILRNYTGKKTLKNGDHTKQFLRLIAEQHGCFNDGGNEYQRIGWYGNDRPLSLKIYVEQE